MQLYLHPDLYPHLSPSISPFDQMMQWQGECFRHQKGRMTQRIQIGEKTYFIKQHHGVGWKEVFKNLLQGRLPVISARQECLAIQRLEKWGIRVPRLMGYGWRGKHPATYQSFILLEEIAPAISLEQLILSKNYHYTFLWKRTLIQAVATIARIMHEHGMNHKDFYLCHLLLNPEYIGKYPVQLTLIDLHRAEVHSSLRLRWRIKDLAALYFSSQEAKLTSRDYYRFMSAYRQKKLRDVFRLESNLWKQIKVRGEKLYAQHSG